MPSSTTLMLMAIAALGIVPSDQAPLAAQPMRLPLRRLASRHHEHAKRDLLSGGLLGAGLTAPILNDVELCQYGVDVQVGTPAQSFLLLLDTGSSDTWVPSKQCSTDKGCISGRQYNSDMSITHNDNGKVPVNITYGIGYASGNYLKDTVRVGALASQDQTLIEIAVNDGPIAQQSVMEGASKADIIDGIFGAGFPHGTLLSETHNETYLPFPMALWQQQRIPAPVFSLTMANGSENAKKSDWLGQITLGAIDTTVATKGDVQYTSVIKRNDGFYSHWAANVLGFQYDNGTFLNYKFDVPNAFIIDSGSNFMYLPANLADELAITLSKGSAKWDNESTTYQVDCALMNDNSTAFSVMFPQENNATLSFSAPVPVSRLVGRIGQSQHCYFYFTHAVNGVTFTLGNLWLRHFLSVFDFGAYRIGFAPLAA
ncbi:aspartic peptidase domain-containing protein [Gongronella butleri]|nr:aspartic peptidase domain-containing protein [Gongronella butleri]